MNSQRRIITSIQAKETIISQISKYAVDIFSVCFLLALCLFALSSENKVQATGILTFFVAATTRIVPSLLRTQNGFFSLRISLSTVRTMNVDAQGSQKDLFDNSSVKVQESNFRDYLTPPSNYTEKIVEFRETSFCYPDSEKVIVDNFNLSMEFGDRIGILGESGSGKSTLADLLVGLLQPTKGSVRIFGVEPNLYVNTLGEKSIGYVPQDVPLFPETLYENLVLGDHSITQEEVLQVLLDLNLGKLVEDLSNGLNTVVGPTGRILSGGQKQRLGVARALLRKPQLLILDEATSSLDAENERIVRETYENLLDGISLFVISHKLSLLESMDALIVLEQGRTVFTGSYSDFISSRKLLEK